MRVAWRQPALILFAISSTLLVLLVVWWGIFFSLRVTDLKRGRIAELELAALQYALAQRDTLSVGAIAPTDLPLGLMLAPRELLTGDELFRVSPDPLAPWVLVPTAEEAQQIQDFFARKRFMILSEGALLVVLVLVSLGSIAASQAKAFRLNWEMGNFLQAITHELKSPLTSLRLLLETLQSNPNALADPGAALEAGLQQVGRLERLIGNVLQASALESRQLHLNLAGFELAREVRIYAQEREAEILARGGSLTLDLPLPVVIRYDRGALRQVLDNLLDNALKYSPAAPDITVRVRADEVHAILEVTDTGIGLAAADQARVFERFWRAGDELTRESEGTGLGLYLVQQLVTQVGGRVQASSPGPGLGTTVTIRWPKGSPDDLIPTRDLIPAG